MCLMFRSSDNPQPQVADEDIVVWKAITRRKRPPIQPRTGVVYKVGVLQPRIPISLVPDPASPSNWCLVREGYHSCASREHCIYYAYTMGLCTPNGGPIGNKLPIQFVKFIIPKGTTYYRNGSHFVSETIMRRPIQDSDYGEANH